MSVSDWINLAGFAQFLIGGAFAIITTLLTLKWPHKWLWKFKRKTPIVICLATSTQVDTGKYTRSATGIGQVNALSEIMPSIMEGYGHNKKISTRLSADMSVKDLESELILVGGAKNNAYTQRVMDEFFEQSGARYTDDLNTLEVDGEAIVSTSADGQITKDYGMILRLPNPYTGNRTSITIIAGLHTYGTGAAAKYLVRNMSGLGAIKRKYFLKIIEFEVVQGESIRPKVHIDKVITL